jgi:hypothetical protein
LTEYKQSGNNHDNYPDLFDILREKQKMRIGHPQSGEYVILEYSVKGANPKPESSTEIPTSSDLIDDAVSEANANPLPESSTSESIKKYRTDKKPEPPEENVRSGSKSMSEKTLKSDELISETQAAASRSLTDFQRKCLEQRREMLQEEWQTRFDKSKKLRCSNASEAGISIQFQLEKEIKSEEAKLLQLDRELNEIEHNLSYDPASSPSHTSSRRLDEKREPPKVFISYSHDSEEHKQNVKLLTEKLHNKGAMIDRYVETNLPENGRYWVRKQVEKSKFVLIVCTQKYKEKVDGHTGGVGLEGAILEEGDIKDNANKCITIIFREEDRKYKFSWLHGNPYVLDTHDKQKYDEEFKRLWRQLTN